MKFRVPWMIFWVGFGLRVAVILIGHTYRIRVDQGHFNFGWEMGRIARSVATGQGFANPFNGVSGPTAWCPPIYPLLMALSFKLFGVYSNGAALFLLVVNSVFSAGIAPGVYEIAARCFDAKGVARRRSKHAEPVALWSGWLWAVYPAALQYAIHWIWEMSVSAFLFTWIIVLALRIRGVGDSSLPTLGDDKAVGEDGAPRFQPWIWFGVLWGLLNLSNASLLLCLPAMMIWIGWPELKRLDWPVIWRSFGGAMLAGVVMCVVMAPWWVRNERALHAFVPTRSNLGFELYESTRQVNDGFQWGTTLPLWPGDPQFRHYVQVGEIQMGKEQAAKAAENRKAMPGQMAKWYLQRFLFFWDGTPHPPEKHPGAEFGRQLSYAFISACGLLGLALMLRRRVVAAGLMAIVFVLLPLPYYLITVQPRFRHPMEPLIAVLAVYLFRSTEKPRDKAVAG
ncbi:hypothetical protein [Granulicella paludicola]|uniref:hypothetical protein n=1 Tax=Granulicella paludicola TaxID=474951 RepID=UPI0021DF5EBB|nr:hypothetical protein [Granulicella paludicola]